MTRVAIIGAGRGGTALIEILHKDPLVRIVGIADVNRDAPGIDVARRLKISTTTDFRQLLSDDVDIVIDVTGSRSVRDALEEIKGRVEVIGGLSAKFMWQLIEERIKSKALTEALRAKYSFENIIGRNAKMQEIFKLLPELAKTKATVLIEGESGTGKELIAHAIHQFSPREDKPFIKVNCGALAEGILESELFGHVKGAFTGAVSHKIGRFELADGGTIFLDEIGDINLSTQIKLLRVIQEGEFEKVGDNRKMKVDVRIIAATNKNLRKAVEQGEFRQDLYYRLRVVPIFLPPLRERKDDIPLLVEHFIGQFNKEMGKKVVGVAPEAMRLLLAYDYPGNIRELENIIEHVLVLCSGNVILPEHLQKDIQQTSRDLVGKVIDKTDPLDDLERELIVRLLTQSNWNYTKTAERL
ncbi:MAG TPA: sigma 54-interacting transcriptional regulator, partial [Nitrospiria bacterium]|nr:sigma 54-interacting transcriptional regulator [Nitrospiria bacterium]